MSEPFSPGALRLCGLTMRTLGWRPDDFWAATPAELAALLAPDSPSVGSALNRDELNALLEHEHDRRTD